MLRGACEIEPLALRTYAESVGGRKIHEHADLCRTLKQDAVLIHFAIFCGVGHAVYDDVQQEHGAQFTQFLNENVESKALYVRSLRTCSFVCVCVSVL